MEKRVKKQPLVSVILPVYNECSFLQIAIDSIINQSYSNIEIIIVNDGSTNPKVEEICFKYINKIVYLKKQNGGVASALNYAINVAKGQYIARMDGDDISYPERIYKQVKFLEENKDIDICGTNYDCINENGRKIFNSNLPLVDSEIKLENIFQNSLCHPSIMFRREIFNNNLRYDENAKAEDYELWLRLEKKVKFANLEERLIGYRYNAYGITKTNPEEIGLSAGRLIKNHLNKLMNNAFENMNEYSFGNVGFIVQHSKDISLFLQEQIYIYSTIIKWNKDSQYYNSFYLGQTINKRWKDCLTISGLKNLLIKKNEKKYLEIQYFVSDQSNHKKFYEIVVNIINTQLDTIKAEKKYMIYSIGIRGQAVYNEFLNLKRQQKIHWDMVGFGDRKEGVEKLFSYPVYSISEISNLKFDYIIIASNKYFEEIENELIDRGIAQNKILDSNWIQWIKMYIE